MSNWNGSAAVVWALWSQCSHTLVWWVGTITPLSLNQHLKSQLVETLPLVRFQSQQCIIIHHTHNEQLVWSRCSGLGIMVQALTYFGLMSGENMCHFPLANTSKVSWWRRLNLMLDSNLNSASSFIIPIMSNWNGPDSVVWALWSQRSHTLVSLVGKTCATFPWPTHQKWAGGDGSTR